MKKKTSIIIFLVVMMGSFLCANPYTYKAINGSPKGKIVIYNTTGEVVKEIQVYSYSKTSIICETDTTLYVVAYENSIMKPPERSPLYPLYKIDLTNGKIEIVDYCTHNAIVSLDGKYVLYDTALKPQEAYLVLREVGSKKNILEIPAKEFRASGFGVAVKRTDNGCIVSLYEDDGYLEVSFDTLTYKVLKDYKPN